MLSLVVLANDAADSESAAAACALISRTEIERTEFAIHMNTKWCGELGSGLDQTPGRSVHIRRLVMVAKDT